MTNFGDLPEEYSSYKNSRIIVVPVPYDETSTWLKGADKGPDAIIEASANMELYDIETDSEVYKKGIFLDSPVTEKSSPEKMSNAVGARVKKHLKKEKFVVCLGGEHSISMGAIKAHNIYKNLSVLQLDAHTDLRDKYSGSRYNHACVMARVREICPIVQVGVRSMDVSERKYIDKEKVFFAHDIIGKKEWIDKVVSKLTQNVYLTIDLDVFDPSIIPSTGTPEPGGLSWYDVLELIKNIINKKNLVGFDVVELCPNESNKAPNFLAAKLIYKILSYRFKEEKK